MLCAILGVLCADNAARGAEVPRQLPTAESPQQAQGYLVYCPCMGRFGNQVDQLLGAMAAAHAAGRTLVLPPFIEYQVRENRFETRFVPFEQYLSVAAVREFVPAVTMEQFMSDPTLAAALWPAAQRRLYCTRSGPEGGCRMPSGNPQKTFWDHYGIAFAGSLAAGSALQSLPRELSAEQHPVIALADSPGRYPVTGPNRDLQRYLRWNDEVRRQGEAFITDHITRPFVAVHLRNGSDWQRACQSAEGQHEFLSSPQCGLSRTAPGPKRSITQAICLPGPDEVVRKLRLAQRDFGPFRTVFVGTDADDYLPQLQAALGDGVRVVRGGAPQLDLYIFTQADLFIGNCVSSFTAFAVRDRRVHRRPSVFFGVEPLRHGK